MTTVTPLGKGPASATEPLTARKLFCAGEIKKIGQGNTDITDAQVDELVRRHEQGDYGDISPREIALNDRYVKKPSNFPDASVQSRFSLDKVTVAISTEGLHTGEPKTEIMFTHHLNGKYIAGVDDGKPIPPLPS